MIFFIFLLLPFKRINCQTTTSIIATYLYCLFHFLAWLQYTYEFSYDNFSNYTIDPTLSWDIISPSSPDNTSNCSNENLFGGYEIFTGAQSVEKTYLHLPSHNAIQIGFNLYLLDDWSGQIFSISIDGTLVFTSSYNNQNATSNLCGNPNYNDQIIPILIQETHTSPSVTITISANLTNAVNEVSWGFRDLNISINFDCFPLCNTCNGNICTDLVQFAKQDPIPGNITCKDGFYPTQNFSESICMPCDYSCRTCWGNSNKQCYSCNGND